MDRKPIIGLTGGVGSGKSTVASLLAEYGAAIIDSDSLNRAQLESAEVVEELTSWWGESILGESGLVDRRKIAAIVFDDPTERKRLENFLHPRIARHRDRLIDAFQRDDAVGAIVLDSPLLIETGLDRRCDVVLFIDASPEVRRERVRLHRGWSYDEWTRRENSQAALDKKRSRADYVVANNSSSIDELRRAVGQFLKQLIAARGGQNP